MDGSAIEQARLAYRRGNPRLSLTVAEKSLAADAARLSPRERYELCVLKSHSLSAMGQWKEALTALDAAPVDELDLEARARLAMHKGYLLGSLTHYSECWSLLHQAEESAENLGMALLRAEVL